MKGLFGGPSNLLKTQCVCVCCFILSPDVFDLSLTDSCLQEGEETTTENGINPELAKVGIKKSSLLQWSLTHTCLYLCGLKMQGIVECVLV